MTENGLAWRPSMFDRSVSHITRSGDTPKVTARYGEARYVHAACGQNTSADDGEAWWMSRCMECVLWLRAQHG